MICVNLRPHLRHLRLLWKQEWPQIAQINRRFAQNQERISDLRKSASASASSAAALQIFSSLTDRR